MRKILGAVATLALVASACSNSDPVAGKRSTGGTPQASGASVPFKKATLIVETNATDGDAGLQINLDHEPWRSISIFRSDGAKILEIESRGVLTNYGLTELFSESSEPPFKTFPFEKFKQLFPPGEYRFVGTTIEGQRMEGLVTLTHNIPEGPALLAPEEDGTVARTRAVVRWAPVTKPAGITMKGYQVIVTQEVPVVRVFQAELPATATSLTIPAEFLISGVEYKVEVQAIETGGNQTFHERTFTVS
ncbi:MAG: hypothetical protein ACRDJM_10200 [Actinomycetota bacterium]